MSTDAPSPPIAGEPPQPAIAEPADPSQPPSPAPGGSVNTQLLILKDKVQRYIGDLLGNVEVTPDGRFTFQAGSTRLFVTCSAWGEDNTLVNVTAPVLTGCAATPELFEHIATSADDYLFGHLSALRTDDGTITVLFSHLLLGDYLDPEELKHAVGGVVSTADQIDDDLKARFGGKRFHDDVT